MVFSLLLKASKIFRSILEMLGNLRVIRKSLLKNWESSDVFGLVNSWAVWPLPTIFGVLGVFLAVSRVFRGIMGCSRGVPGLFRAVPGYSRLFRGCSGGVPGVFRGVPGFTETPQYVVRVKIRPDPRTLHSNGDNELTCSPESKKIWHLSLRRREFRCIVVGQVCAHLHTNISSCSHLWQGKKETSPFLHALYAYV